MQTRCGISSSRRLLLAGFSFHGTDEEKFEQFLEDLAEDRTWASTESIKAVQGLYGGTVKVHNPTMNQL